jgi:hypothetical protein
MSARTAAPRAWRWSALAGLALAVVAYGAISVRRQLASGNDFPIYYAAARTVLQGGSPYDVSSGLHGYVYLPPLALALAPLTALPLPAAAWVWYAINVALGALGFRIAARLVLDATGRPIPRGVLPATAVALGGLFLDNLVLGQANLLMLVLTLAAIRGLVMSDRDYLPGVLLGLAATVKPYALFLLGPPLLRARWRVIAGAVVGLAASMALIPALVVGPGRTGVMLDAWKLKVFDPAVSGTLQKSRIWDQSPQAALRRLVVAEPAFDGTRVNVIDVGPDAYRRASRATSAVLAAGLLAVWTLARGRGGRAGLLADMALALCGTLLLVGYNLRVQFVQLLLPGVLAAAIAWGGEPGRGPGTAAARAALGLGAALVLLSNAGLVGRLASNWLLACSSVTWATLLLAGVLAAQRMRETGEARPG